MTERDNLWLRLEGKIAGAILRAPRTCADPLTEGEWPLVDGRVVSYIEKHIVGAPWADFLALFAIVASARHHQPHTILAGLNILNCRLRDLFSFFNLKAMSEWDAEQYLPRYLSGEVFPEHSVNARAFAWLRYISALRLLHRWLKSLPEAEREVYRPYIPALIDHEFASRFLDWAEIRQTQRGKRKSETDALVTRFAEIRGEASFRFNRMARLKGACDEAVARAQENGHELPFDFSYDEVFPGGAGESPRERFHLRVWDRRSFVLAHKESYSPTTVNDAVRRKRSFRRDKDETFIEFVGAEHLVGDAPPEGLWFAELIRRDVLGGSAKCGTPGEVAEKQVWLREWGYGDGAGPGELLTPFKAHEGGVLVGAINECVFQYRAQSKTGCVLIPVDQFYRAALFGLLAIHLITTTGMRINEVIQIRADGDCLVRVSMPAPPGARDRSLRVRHVLRVVPKGESPDRPHDYFISKEVVRLMSEVGRMVYDDYGLSIERGDKIPSVNFTRQCSRYHQFGPAPYLLQHNNKHLGGTTLTACMRFLLHGLVFRTTTNKIVVLKPHLLRHAFATHAAQVEGVPLDILGKILQQKNLRITDYYSQPTETFIGEEVDRFFARIATHVNVNEAALRSPEEIGRMVEESLGRVGAMANVIGGQCVVSNYCIGQWRCIGCVGHAPDPEKRAQVEEKKTWAEAQVEMATREGLTVELEQMKKLMRDCEATLREMDLIEAYREDKQRAALIQIEGRRKN